MQLIIIIKKTNVDKENSIYLVYVCHSRTELTQCFHLVRDLVHWKDTRGCNFYKLMDKASNYLIFQIGQSH